MLEQNKYPAFRLKVILTSFIVISMSLMLTTLSENMTKGLMHGIIYGDDFFFTLIKESLLYGLIPGIISGLIINKFLKPVHDSALILFNGDDLEESARVRAIKRVSKLNVMIISLNVFVYLIEFIIFLVSASHPIDQIVIELLYAITSAFIFGTIQANIINMSMSKAKSLFKIYSFESGIMRISMQKKNVGLIFFLTVFISITFINASQIITMSNTHYQNVLEEVVSGQKTLDEGRREYKDGASKMVGAESSKIVFPYDNRGETNTIPIFLIYFIQLLIITVVFQYTSSLFQKKQLHDLNEKMKEISSGNGDLTKQVEIAEFNEIGQLTNTINSFLNGLRSMLKDLQLIGSDVKSSAGIIREVLISAEESTHDIVTANEQSARSTKDQIKIADATTKNIRDMLSSVNDIADNIETQSTSVEQTSSAINEMAANIESVNKTTSIANDLSNNLVTIADKGGNAVNQSITAVKRVEEFSNEIIQMVKVITNISDKTNLLAMNAAIEAAHAGESGKGFAVVAQEVRKLAEDSAISAQQISDHIKKMVGLVNDGVNLSEGAGKALHTVGVDVKQTSQLIQEVSAAMDEQTAGTREVLDAITTLMNSTLSIRGITKLQQEKNIIMNKSIDDLGETFSQIEIAAQEQNNGTRKIQKSVSELKKVVLDNENVTNKLDKLLGGFIL